MDKKALTEADIRTKFITTAIAGEGGSKWNVMTQMLEERYFTKSPRLIESLRHARSATMSSREPCIPRRVSRFTSALDYSWPDKLGKDRKS